MIWLAALPLVALRFHLVSPIGILLNVPLIPLTSAALLLSGLGLALSPLWVPLSIPPMWAAAVLLKLSRAIVFWGVAQPWGHSFVAGPPWGWVLVFYVVLGLAVVFSRTAARPAILGWLEGRRVWWPLAAWVFPGWLLWSTFTARSPGLEVEFLAVGHGLAVIIQTPDGQTILYDCGRMGDPTVGRRIIAPALWASRASRIDLVLLSHADSDHYGGLADLLDRFPITEVQAPPGFATGPNSGAIELINQVRSRGIPVRSIAAPFSWENGGVRFTVWHPSARWHLETSDNARSLVLDIAYLGRHLLLTGDLELLGLDELVLRPAPDPPPDVMLAPHHGGRSANPDWLYDWAKPQIVVVSQRPPPPRTNDALSQVALRGMSLLRTWQLGAIRLRWSDGGIDIRTFVGQKQAQADSEDLAPNGQGAQDRPPRGIVDSNRLPAWHAHAGVKLLAGLLGFALGAIACLVMAVVEIGAWALVMPSRSIKKEGEHRHHAPEHSPGPDAQQIAVRAIDGVQLAARWFPLPGAKASGRTVLLLHGFAERSSDLEARRVAVLHRHGWNVASVDSRAYGQSEGLYSTFGGREAHDLRVWLDALSAQIARLDPSLPFQPVLWGRSMGAAIAVRAAALDERIVALVLESPMVDLEASTAVLLRKRRLPFSRSLARLVVRRAGKLVGMPIHQPGPVETAARVVCSCLIVHGTLDVLVPIAEARRLADAFRGKPCWLDVAEAKHTDVLDVGGDPLLDQIAAFLDDVMTSGKPADAPIGGAD